MGARKLFKLYVDYFKALNQLQSRILLCYSAKDFLTKHFKYEKKIYRARSHLFSIMNKIRFVVQQEKVSHLSALENMYEIVFSLNSLKFRVSDLSVFEICQAEIMQLAQSINDVLRQMILFFAQQERKNKKIFLDGMAKTVSQLSHGIDSFEEVYRVTLQIVAPEPIFFLFFLQDFIALREKLESFFLGFLND